VDAVQPLDAFHDQPSEGVDFERFTVTTTSYSPVMTSAACTPRTSRMPWPAPGNDLVWR
jgi:hypothetical protein